MIRIHMTCTCLREVCRRAEAGERLRREDLESSPFTLREHGYLATRADPAVNIECTISKSETPFSLDCDILGAGTKSLAQLAPICLGHNAPGSRTSAHCGRRIP